MFDCILLIFYNVALFFLNICCADCNIHLYLKAGNLSCLTRTDSQMCLTWTDSQMCLTWTDSQMCLTWTDRQMCLTWDSQMCLTWDRQSNVFNMNRQSNVFNMDRQSNVFNMDRQSNVFNMDRQSNHLIFSLHNGDSHEHRNFAPCYIILSIIITRTRQVWFLTRVRFTFYEIHVVLWNQNLHINHKNTGILMFVDPCIIV